MKKGFTLALRGQPKTTAYTNFYYRHSELILKKYLLKDSSATRHISEPLFYGDLVYKFKRIVGKPNFNDQFKKIFNRYLKE